jgi:flagellin
MERLLSEWVTTGRFNPMRINQNIMAFNAYRNLTSTNTDLGKSLEKLSSGFRINRAADDAAGLVVSEGLRAQVSGLRVATRNAQDGVSVVQTAEGALTEVHSMLRRMRDLAVQASNTGANDADARAAAQSEIDELAEEVDRVANQTKFGQVSLLNGSYGVTAAVVESVAAGFAPTAGEFAFTNADTFTVDMAGGGAQTVTVDATSRDRGELRDYLENVIRGAVYANDQDASVISVKVEELDTGNWRVEISAALADTETLVLADTTNTPLADIGITTLTGTASGSGGVFQVGANATETITVAIDDMDAAALGLGVAGASLDVENNASSAITLLDAAISTVSTQRGELGAVQNRFEHTVANLSVTAENLAASESRIRDTDMALELVSFTRHQILQQAGTAMLAQANQVPSSVLSLLG